MPELGPDMFPLHGCLAPLGKRSFGSSKWHPTHASFGLKTATRITPETNVCYAVATMKTTVDPLYPVGTQIIPEEEHVLCLGLREQIQIVSLLT